MSVINLSSPRVPNTFGKCPRGREKMEKLARSFSVDSLGDSTRSLLSPLYNCGSPEPSLSEGPLSSDDEFTDNQKGSGNIYKGSDNFKYDGNRPRARSAKTSSPRHTNSYSYDLSFASANDGSKSSMKRSRTENSTSRSYSSRRELSNLDSRQSSDGNRLSSWEDWLVKKTLQQREKAEVERLKKMKKKEEMERRKKEEEEKARKAEEKRKEWLESKNREETEKRRTKKEMDCFERQKKEELKRITEEKARDNFEKWRQEKREKMCEKLRKDQEDAKVAKSKEVDRKLKNEEAFEEWMTKARSRPKLVHGSFGYTNGTLTGYYEWGTYPAPSYVNPIPWVHPKARRNKGRQKGRRDIQPPSPPLLFKELEQRMSRKKSSIHKSQPLQERETGKHNSNHGKKHNS